MHVTAVLAVSGHPERVSRALEGLQRQTRRPDRIVVVDGLQDPQTADLLRGDLGGNAHLTWVTPGSSISAAVSAALNVAPPVGAEEAAGEEWLWILTQDGDPAPDALDLLLVEAETSPSVAVAGCSSVSWDDDQQLLDVGLSVTALGARIRGVDLREVAQGQYDDRRDVYAVPLTGMLVRRSTYTDLGGFDPALRGSREDLDLCRRVHLAGQRVVVVPAARIARHVPGPGRLARPDRADAVHLRLAGVTWWLLVPAWLLSLLTVLPRAAWRMVLKQPGIAVEEAGGSLASLASPIQVARARLRQRRTRRVPRRVLRRLRPTWRQVWWQRREDLTAYRYWAGAFDDTDESPRLPSRREPGLPLTSLTDAEAEADVGLVPVTVRRRPPLLAGALAVLLALAAGLVAARRLLPHAGEALSGPALLPAPERLSRLWTDAVTTWRPVGLGRRALGDSFDQVLALTSLPLAATPRVAVLAVLVLAVPLSAWTAWLAAGALTRSRLLRPWAGLAWASAPVLLLGVREGRLGLLIAHALLPLFCWTLARAAGVAPWRPPLQVPSTGVSTALLAAAAARDAQARRPRASVTAASAAGVLFVLLVACAPWTAVPLALLVLAAVLAAPSALRMERRERRRCRWVLSWTAIVAALAAAPWWWEVARHPRLLLVDPALVQQSTATPPSDVAPGWPDVVLGGAGRAQDLVGGSDGAPVRRLAELLPSTWAPHAEAIWTGVVVAMVAPAAVLAVLALLAAGRRRSVAGFGALLALSGACVWLAATRTELAGADGQPTAGWSGTGLSLIQLGLLAGALVGADAGRRRIRAWRRRPLRVLATPLAAGLLLAGPLLTLPAWAWTTPTAAGVTAAAPDAVPAVAVAEAEGPAATRTLALRVGGTVEWTLLRAPGPRLGQRSTAWALDGGDARDASVVVPVLGRLLSDTGADVRTDLGELAVGTVLLLPPLDPAAQASLDASPGLVRNSGSDDDVLSWRVDLAAAGRTRPARAWIDGPGTAPADMDASDPDRLTATLLAASGPRRLVLAERADHGWRARLDGARLRPTVVDGWAQAFDLPATGGRLVVEHRDPTVARLQLLAWATLALAALVAVPLPGRRRPPAPPRPSWPVGRDTADPTAAGLRAASGVAEEDALERWATGSWPVVGDEPAVPPGEDPGPEVEAGPDPDPAVEDAQGAQPAEALIDSPLDVRDSDDHSAPRRSR